MQRLLPLAQKFLQERALGRFDQHLRTLHIGHTGHGGGHGRVDPDRRGAGQRTRRLGGGAQELQGGLGRARLRAQQVVRGLNKDGAGQWRRFAKEMAPVLPVLAPWVARYGYEDPR